MKILEHTLNGAMLIQPKVFHDKRGYLFESYSKKKMEDIGLFFDFVQDNHSFSSTRGTLRGLHFQIGKEAQTKLVRCAKGKILDVIVDIRRDSPTFLKSYSAELSEDNQLMLLVPRGFAHGFLCLTNDCHIMYKVDNYYAPNFQSGIRYDDPTLNIKWPIHQSEIILSDQDQNLKPFDPKSNNY